MNASLVCINKWFFGAFIHTMNEHSQCVFIRTKNPEHALNTQYQYLQFNEERKNKILKMFFYSNNTKR